MTKGERLLSQLKNCGYHDPRYALDRKIATDDIAEYVLILEKTLRQLSGQANIEPWM